MVFIPNHQKPNKIAIAVRVLSSRGRSAAELWPSFLGRGRDFDLDPVLDNGTRCSLPTADYVRFSECSSPKSLPKSCDTQNLC
jgi:hypothetical protein